MTANQVAYWQLQEAKRHNVVSEGQQERDVSSRERDVATRARVGEAQIGRYANQNEVDLRKIASQEKLNNSQVALNTMTTVTKPVDSASGLIKSLGSLVPKLF